MSQPSSYPPPPYGGTPQDGPPKRSRGPLVLVIVLGLVLIATVVVGAVVLLGRDDSKSASGGSAGVPASPESLRFRSVLNTEPNACNASTPAKPGSNTACGADGTRYTLGPVALDGTHVAEVRTDQNQGSGDPSWQVNLTLDTEGEATFTKLTTELATKNPPQNQLAIVVRGKVVSAPTVMSAITGGKVQITAQFTKADADKLAADITG
ncbi:hypothetical protein AB0P21_10220 [Kribbella sp. NPDC056861]|uniref:SecDF P1 head subdomain-containing protein n=1 Tax=Kribbella sp. NPDC056861 TaxID=3154857 RepID=UPI003422BA59